MTVTVGVANVQVLAPIPQDFGVEPSKYHPSRAAVQVSTVPAQVQV